MESFCREENEGKITLDWRENGEATSDWSVGKTLPGDFVCFGKRCGWKKACSLCSSGKGIGWVLLEMLVDLGFRQKYEGRRKEIGRAD